MSSSAGSGAAAAEASSQHADWPLHVDTKLVNGDWEAALRGARVPGGHPPRPLVAPIFATSTYRLESAKEGEVLSNTLAKVRLHACSAVHGFKGHFIIVLFVTLT